MQSRLTESFDNRDQLIHYYRKEFPSILTRPSPSVNGQTSLRKSKFVRHKRNFTNLSIRTSQTVMDRYPTQLSDHTPNPKPSKPCKVSEIHKDLWTRNNIRSDLLQLNRIESHLPQQLQAQLTPQQLQIFGRVNNTNKAFIELLQPLVCYKAEMGVQFQQLLECYNLLILQLVEADIKTKLSVTNHYKQQKQQLAEQTKSVSESGQEVLYKLGILQQVIRTKDQHIQDLQDQIDQFKKEEKPQQAQQLASQSDSSESKASFERLDQSLQAFSQAESHRTQNASQLLYLVKRLMKRGVQEVACQHQSQEPERVKTPNITIEVSVPKVASLDEIVSMHCHGGKAKFPWVYQSFLTNFVSSIQATYTPKRFTWSHFKQTLTSILKHRVDHAQEIQGSQTYMSFSEHLTIYMLLTNESQFEAQQSLLDFIVSLRFFERSWLKALHYATLCFGQPDYFIEEFYLHACSLVQTQQIVESVEGHSHLLRKSEETVSSSLLAFLPPLEMQKVHNQVDSITVRMKDDPMSDFDTDFVDLDKLMDLYLKTFQEQRQLLQQKNLKLFQRLSVRPEVSYLFQESQGFKLKPIQPFVSHPGNVTAARVMLHAFNSTCLDAQLFLAACSKYGWDCPTPCVVQRLAFYGNEEGIIPDKCAQFTCITDSKVPQISKREMKETKRAQAGLADAKVRDSAPAKQIVARSIRIKMKDLQPTEIKKPSFVVPSMGYVSDLFVRHCRTISQLHHKVCLLQQALQVQHDPDIARQQLTEVALCLEEALAFLNQF